MTKTAAQLQKEFYERHPEKRREYFESYLKTHPEARDKAVKRTRDWRKKNPEKSRQAIIAWKNRYRFTSHHLWKWAFHTAQKRGWKFTLTEKWIQIQLNKKVCARSGIPFAIDCGNHNPFAPSIDRIDSSKGYTPTNCQLVCRIYNLAKNRYKDETVLQLALGVVHIFKKRYRK